MLNNKDYFNVLFDPEDITCFAENAKGTRVFNQHPSSVHCLRSQFFSINPLADYDLNPRKIYHRKERARRADCNVTKFRNFLIELDQLPLDLQQVYIKSLEMPYTTKVFSGKKSFHYIIALETPLSSSREYAELAKRLHKVVVKADHSTKNPSRLSRVPGVIRADTGNAQELFESGSRIPNWFFCDWLESHGSFKEEDFGPNFSEELSIVQGETGLNGFTKNFLMFGAEVGCRNSDLFKASCNFARQRIPIEAAIVRFFKVPGLLSDDFTEQELLGTIASGYSSVTASGLIAD